MRGLQAKYAKRRDVAIVIVEQKEPHCGRMAFEDVAQPATFEERRALAIKCRDELELPLTFLVDGMDDASRALFGDLPSPAFLVDASGIVREKLPWADPELLEAKIEAIAGDAAGSTGSDPTPAGGRRALEIEPSILEAKARAAWQDRPGRLVAGLCDFAERHADPDAAVELWKSALQALEARAPKLQRTWIEQQLAAAEQKANAPSGGATKAPESGEGR